MFSYFRTYTLLDCHCTFKKDSQYVSTVSTEAGLFSRRTLKYLITLCWIPLPSNSHSHLVVLSDVPSLLACF